MNSHKNEIKVSVIVPVYNVERYLRQSILSIINQTLKEIEIILVNDGSTDNSLSIMKELAAKDNRIKIFSQPNHGQSIARNIGLIHATGEYIYFFDSDDLLEDIALEECYNKCQLHQLDFLFFDADIFSEDNISMEFNSYSRTYKFIDKTYVGTDLLKEQFRKKSFSASVCLTFISKKYLDSLNLYFYPGIIHEDILFVFQLYLKANEIGLIKKTYFHRRLRPNSTMTTTFSKNNIMGYLTVCRELKSIKYLYQTTQIEKGLLKKIIADLLLELIYKSSILSPKDYNTLTNVMKKEFRSFFNIRLALKLYFPIIYNFFKYIKTIK